MNCTKYQKPADAFTSMLPSLDDMCRKLESYEQSLKICPFPTLQHTTRFFLLELTLYFLSFVFTSERGVGGTVASESALRSAGTILLQCPGLMKGLKA
ncbi:hypothetical protein PoB_005364700 [Plakobranchus ocellatus]|uniref:Uncharacterized protein n=1 Tax=Plakobranchus ocellatus TaxID=259542 RepID=A0AAV4C6Y8_9GAST|nr:hypothetical protein PoB_005364700 [Plakobranchus ocellatus]